MDLHAWFQTGITCELNHCETKYYSTFTKLCEHILHCSSTVLGWVIEVRDFLPQISSQNQLNIYFVKSRQYWIKAKRRTLEKLSSILMHLCQIFFLFLVVLLLPNNYITVASISLYLFVNQPFRYYKRDDAQKAMCYINRTKLDDRTIRTDWDAGFVEGRQFGRGRTGGQVCSVCVCVCVCALCVYTSCNANTFLD